MNALSVCVSVCVVDDWKKDSCRYCGWRMRNWSFSACLCLVSSLLFLALVKWHSLHNRTLASLSPQVVFNKWAQHSALLEPQAPSRRRGRHADGRKIERVLALKNERTSFEASAALFVTCQAGNYPLYAGSSSVLLCWYLLYILNVIRRELMPVGQWQRSTSRWWGWGWRW